MLGLPIKVMVQYFVNVALLLTIVEHILCPGTDMSSDTKSKPSTVVQNGSTISAAEN